MQFNRVIAYTYSWRKTLYIGLILGGLIAAILVFLQPFDTYESVLPYKNLKLTGYGFCVLLPILVMHALENSWYRRQQERWFLFNEMIVIPLTMGIIIGLSYLYNVYVINDLDPDWNSALGFFRYFGLPFVPFTLPLWVYLRFTFGEVSIKKDAADSPQTVTIEGENAEDRFVLPYQNFVLAQAQKNYVDIYFLDEEEILQKEVIRSTLSNLIDQLPQAHQVHRSFLVNLAFIKELKGNARKRWIELTPLDWEVPVSSKHYKAIEKHFQIRP